MTDTPTPQPPQYYEMRCKVLEEAVENFMAVLDRMTGRRNAFDWDGLEAEVQRRLVEAGAPRIITLDE